MNASHLIIKLYRCYRFGFEDLPGLVSHGFAGLAGPFPVLLIGDFPVFCDFILFSFLVNFTINLFFSNYFLGLGFGLLATLITSLIFHY